MGEDVTEFLVTRDLFILNDPDFPTTFNSSRGKSWNDLTICTPSFIRSISKRTALDELTASEHNYIEISIKPTELIPKRILTKTGLAKLLDHLQEDIWLITTEQDIKSKAQLEHMIRTMYRIKNGLWEKFSSILQSSLKESEP